jgi:hypothetical protein
MTERGELVRLSQDGTIEAVLRLAKSYADAMRTADCHGRTDEACPSPRTDDECGWARTRFCAARLRDEAASGAQMDREAERLRRIEEATQLGIPKGLHQMLGVATGKPTIRQTEACRFVRHSAASSRIRIVVLNGDDGAGKSVAAALWCWLTQGWYYRATNLRWFTRGGYNQNPADTKLLQVGSVAIVGLDKPWAAKDGSHRHSLVHVLYSRLDAGYRTLITSNLSPSDLDAVLGTGLMRSIGRWDGLARITERADGESAEEMVY